MSILDTLNPFDGGSDPIYPRLPQVQQSFVNKYQQLGPALAPIPLPVRNALIDFDLKRVNKGQAPTSIPQSAKLVASALGKPATKQRKSSPLDIIGNVRSDIGAIVGSIPRLPHALIKEAQALPTAPGEISKALGKGDIAGALQAPGIRFIPGTYIASNLAKGDVAELARHPIFTGLDVLPVAGKLAKGTKVGQAGVEAGINPIRALLTRQATETGLAPNALGRGIETLGTTRPGQLVKQTWGTNAKEAARLQEFANQYVRDLVSPTGRPLERIADPERQAVSEAARAAETLRETYGPQIPQARMAEITRAMQLGDIERLGLSDIERAMVGEAKEITERFARVNVDNGDLLKLGGEIYGAQSSARIVASRERLIKRSGKLTQYEARLDEMALRDPRLAAVRDAIAADNYILASKELNRLTRQKTALAAKGGNIGEKVGPTPDISLAGFGNLRNDIRKAAAAQKSFNALKAKTAPARFRPLLEDTAARQYGDTLVQRAADPAQAATIAQAVMERNWGSIPGFDPTELRSIQKSVEKTWTDLKAAGVDPVFVHHVTPERAVQIQYPRVLEVITKPSQIKARTWDAAPYVQDVTVGLSHQGIELLSRAASEDFVNNLIQRLGKTEQELIDQYLPAARIQQSRRPNLDVMAHAKDLMSREWVNYDPNSIITWKKSGAIGMDTDRVYLPRSVADNLEKSKSMVNGRISAIFDPVMKVFRTSVIGLSPRTHVYNILGGFIQTTARTDASIFKYMGAARKVLKEGGTSLPDELRMSLGSMSRDVAELNYRGGTTLRRLWDQAQESQPTLTALPNAAGKAINAVADKSLKLNAFFDDTYRTAAYLYKFDKSISKGLSKDVANRAGIELARKVMASWDSFTPIERSILRQVFPFYGFMSHILKYVFTYPFDHPVRASIMSQFARNELGDLDTGLPQSFLSSFFLGSPDVKGNVKSVQLSGINPFRDAANYLTLAGFLGATNPVLKTLIQSAGIDVQSGGPDLYPNLEYDATTGKLVANTGNPLTNLLKNTIPQSQVLANLSGSSAEFKQLLRTNPDAAQRMIASNLGIPVLMRTYNVPQEQFKAELVREEAQSTAQSQALKTGNDSYARQFPGLSALLDQVRTLQSQGALRPFTPSQSLPSTQAQLAGVGKALTG